MGWLKSKFREACTLNTGTLIAEKKGFLSSNSNPTCAHMLWPVLLFSALTYSPSASSSRSTSRPLYCCETMCLHNGKNPGSNYLAVSHVNCYMTLEITKVFTWNRTKPILQDIYLDWSTKVFPMRFVCLHFVFHHHVKLPNCIVYIWLFCTRIQRSWRWVKIYNFASSMWHWAHSFICNATNAKSLQMHN